jgi:hypothetical protein
MKLSPLRTGHDYIVTATLVSTAQLRQRPSARYQRRVEQPRVEPSASPGPWSIQGRLGHVDLRTTLAVNTQARTAGDCHAADVGHRLWGTAAPDAKGT